MRRTHEIKKLKRKLQDDVQASPRARDLIGNNCRLEFGKFGASNDNNGPYGFGGVVTVRLKGHIRGSKGVGRFGAELVYRYGQTTTGDEYQWRYKRVWLKRNGQKQAIKLNLWR